ncbi:zinc ABC transporter substrate-binding protein [Ornithinibacillus sp. BX22]|uniref:Zinc ABC transporter substrate-binding protein n=1 Tax=Ornithinibacillus hominis TaxID=2763055 RepID=A0A923RFA6_9BACI|nr:zinc ABC transporter substrate-binding protein [Ornithinibacillus hominis]MBC5635359.1 zinc ABC transporter substrate-binding protein [Ornithinibacillus hominis]
MKNIWLLTSFIGLLLLLAACNTNDENASSAAGVQNTDNTLTIFTSIYPLEDFAKKIGGEHVQVNTLIPPGADSHTFEPTSKDILDIAKADAFIFNGLGMESYAEKVKETLKKEDVVFVEAAEGIEAIPHDHEHHGEEASHDHDGDDHQDSEHDDGHHHGDQDPHVWIDPYQAIVLAENIKNTLVDLKPEAREEFEENFETLKQDLEALDEEFHQLVDSKENPEMIVSHAAYGYWEKSYGIKSIPIAGLSSSQEPSQSELTKLIQVAKEKDLKYVIFEQNITPKVAKVIQDEIGAEALYLHNLSTLTDEDIESGEDYFSLMERNLETLDKALR